MEGSGRQERRASDKKRLMYGELIVVGYNGEIKEKIGDDKGRRKSKFRLFKRATGNGVRPVREHRVRQPRDCKAYCDASQHSVAYTVSKTQAVVVEYGPDPGVDMFQVGRSTEGQMDFIVLDTLPEAARSACSAAPQSTVSRFACRVLVDRKPPYTARLYAAGFDAENNIVIGERCAKWSSQGESDALTTNGVLLNHPQGSFAPGCRPGVWREVSVGGGLYKMRETRAQQKRAAPIEDEDNELADGSLFDLCGVTLLWRSALSLMSSPSRLELEHQVAAINAMRPQCPVGFNTLIISSRTRQAEPERQPYVYLTCGHVHGQHAWDSPPPEASPQGSHPLNADSLTTVQCPLCKKSGPLVKLQLALETSMYVDREIPSRCFVPCGHMASEATMRYWSSIAVPQAGQGFLTICPFCATPLQGQPGYVRLIFQEQSSS